MVKQTVVIVEMLLHRAARAQVIVNVLQCVQVARSMLTVLSFAVTGANNVISLLSLGLFTMLS